MHTQKTKAALIIQLSPLCALLGLIMACGGGSNGSDRMPPETPPPVTPPPAMEEGTAVDLPAMEKLDTGVQHFTLTLEGKTLALHVLDDDMMHISYHNSVNAAALDTLLSDLVAPTEYQGAATLTLSDQRFTTDELAISLDDQLCVSIHNLNDAQLSKVCAPTLGSSHFSFTIDSPQADQAYGLGEQFFNDGLNGDWIDRTRAPSIPFGNRMSGFVGGAVGNLQIPVLLTYQAEGAVGYYIDSPEAQTWNLQTSPWFAGSTISNAANMFVFGGEDLADVREDYVAITGAPPVPPKAAFGLWVSEYGYDNWAEAEAKVNAQHNANMPIDGIVLDLQWFGGINQRQMGSLTWDNRAFPEPHAKLQAWQDNWGLSTVVIEESYIDTNSGSHQDLKNRGYLVLDCPNCDPVFFNDWWGMGSMFDWSHKEGAAYWHETKRTPLIEAGILGHWTDLGEPEIFNDGAWYADTYNDQRHRHADIHNLYNFYWSKSIFDGYLDHQPEARPWILSRSGTAGSQRFGVSLWSGDIGSNNTSLASHMQTQMHMSMSGFDYYGSDVGGFHRGGTTGASFDALYTIWLANSALFDVPLRPHTENLCNCKETAPALAGSVSNNRFNLHLRYRLFPYFYSLAHIAHREGKAIFPPLAYYHADDANVAGLGSVKYIGPNLVARVHNSTNDIGTLDTYLPEGTWLDFHEHNWIESIGESVNMSKRPLGRTTLPLLAKAGAIIPLMYVDEQTMTVEGKRRDDSVRDELILWVAAAPTTSQFTLYEDDGVSTDYLTGEVAETVIRQQSLDGETSVTIAPTVGRYEGMAEQRSYQVEIFIQNDLSSMVELNGSPMEIAERSEQYDEMEEGAYRVSAGRWLAKSSELSIREAKVFRFLSP